jgi:prepilin-type processing-associated H-X9-DG protein
VYESAFFGINASSAAYKYGFSSAHSSGASFVFCDGSTRFLDERMDITTFARILHRADGKVVDSSDF